MCKWFSPTRLIDLAARVVLSSIFGNYSDKREIQAALIDKPISFDYHLQDEIWIDYVADVGDGFASTYTVASLLAKPALRLTNANGTSVETRRGSILVMGGDEVYPAASRDNYYHHTVGPYQAALPCVSNENPPHLFALPGNHDWYDGLTSFLRQFCQQRWIGGWKTQQRTSYFALRLPHGWWLFALDIQLGADIDKPQLDYFTKIMEASDGMQEGDSVILATATPAWVYEAESPQNLQENINYIEKLIEKRKAKVKVNVAGDSHHYARYTNADNTRHRITAGGGGAFMHGTHQLPDKLAVTENSQENPYDLKTCFPGKDISKKITLGNLFFVFRNPWFCLFLSSFLLFTTWVAVSTSVGLGMHAQPLLALSSRAADTNLVHHLWNWFAQILPYSPATCGLLLFFIAGLTGFCEPDPDSCIWRSTAKRISIGVTHACLQIILYYLLFYGYLHLDSTLLQTDAISVWQLLWQISLLLAIGAFGCGILLGIYLYLTSCFLNFHAEAGFSSCRIEDFKNFLRMQITKDGRLHIYPVGIERIEKKWQRNRSTKQDEPQFIPDSGMTIDKLATLIDEPIHIGKPHE